MQGGAAVADSADATTRSSGTLMHGAVADESRSGLVWKSRYEQQATAMAAQSAQAAEDRLALEGARARRNRVETDLRDARALVRRLLDKSEVRAGRGQRRDRRSRDACTPRSSDCSRCDRHMELFGC